jgi:peptidoglycan/LPS O-acetylase OafA/YrhL
MQDSPANPAAVSPPTAASAPIDRYLPQLDTLRALAVALVIVQHGTPGRYAFKWWFPWGGVGVRLFFVLSGFLITQILLTEKRCVEADPRQLGYSLRVFYVRRFLRIVPLFYLSLAVFAALDVPPVRQTIWWHVAYASNFYFVHHGDWHGHVSHLWSLAVEEQFYLFWPWVVLLTPRRWLLPLTAALFALAPLSRYWSMTQGLGEVAAVGLPTSCFDALLSGAAIAMLSEPGSSLGRWRRPFTRVALAIGLPLMVGLCVLKGGRPSQPLVFVVWWDVGLSLFCCWLIDLFVRLQGVAARICAPAPLVLLGRISYGVYVLHNFVPYVVERALRSAGIVWRAEFPVPVLMGAAYTIVVATVVFLLWERPINRLKKYFPYRR